MACRAQTSDAGASDLPSTNSVPNTIVDSSLIDTAALGIELFPTGNYSKIKQEIALQRRTKSTKEDFEHYLLNQIIPHWYAKYSALTPYPIFEIIRSLRFNRKPYKEVFRISFVLSRVNYYNFKISSDGFNVAIMSIIEGMRILIVNE